MKAAPAYRPEIDGLRAVAVISVILFHLGSKVFPGGFVGVDIFFVISGYLITGFIRRALETGGFRYLEFFARRVRRLTPALIFATFGVTLVAYSSLLPRDLSSFAKSVIAQPIAMQNMHFLAEGEYFQLSERKPLLHTWSLGVEEQFYLVWPFVILLVSRWSRARALALLGLVLIASFGLSLTLPIVSPKASFFLFPARAWELGVGGVLAIGEEGLEGPGRMSSRCRAALACIGVALLLISFVWISGDMVFPGWVALLPVAATTILIATASDGGSPIKKALSMRPLVFIGLISYSLYLWHWPVIVFARIFGFDPTSWLIATTIVIISVLLASFSYYFVEKPIRSGRILPRTSSLLSSAAGLGLAVIAAGALPLLTRGLAFRYSEPGRSMLTASFDSKGADRCGFLFRVLHPAAAVCHLNRVSTPEGRGVLLWGNSHAAMWAGLLAEMGDASGRPVYLNTRNCRPVTDSSICSPAVQQEVIASIESNDVTDVVLAGTWYGAYRIPDEKLEMELKAVVRELSSRGLRVWLVLDVPTSRSLDPEARWALDPQAPTLGSLPLAVHQIERRSREAALFRQLIGKFSGVQMVDPTEDFCFDGERCHGGRDGRVWYRDAEHLTDTGAREARDRFVPVFVGAPMKRLGPAPE